MLKRCNAHPTGTGLDIAPATLICTISGTAKRHRQAENIAALEIDFSDELASLQTVMVPIVGERHSAQAQQTLVW